MFNSEVLDNHLSTEDTIKTASRVFAEWNMNDPENVRRLGNYRYRPSDSSSPYFLIPSTYVDIESGPIYYYTGATDSDTVIESGLNPQDQPTFFLSPKNKMKLLYSLEDCIKPFRPRSGINKPLYLGAIGLDPSSAQYIDDGRSYSARRPRYYMASRDDYFKYWTSYRTEYGIPTSNSNITFPEENSETSRGVSFFDPNTQRNYIEDAAPFVVYNEPVPTNKIVVKMQTNVGEISLPNLRYGDQGDIADPLYGDQNKTTPVRWQIQALKNNNWTTLTSFDENSLRKDGSPIIGPDGYVEISYGLEIPEQYADVIFIVGELSSESLLPESGVNGQAYLIKSNSNDIGEIHIYFSDEWVSFTPTYNWHLSYEELSNSTDVVTKLVDPEYFSINNEKFYREFEFIQGIRLVVQTMNKTNCTFDLIEFSPRLYAEITDSVSDFSITKTLSDLGNSSIPVGGLSASTGNITIFDVDFSFNEQNYFDEETSTGSIVSKYLNKYIKFNFYTSINDVFNGFDYHIPIKTMYAKNFPQTSSPSSNLQLELRDFFFFLESSKAPQLLLTEISLSYAIMILLDYIGFDNYIFKRIPDKPELIIPYFFVEPNQNVAEVLQKLAVASQSAMFFDEYNNFVVMSKEYLLPENEEERQTNKNFLGQESVTDSNGNVYPIIDYVYSSEELPNEKFYGAFIDRVSLSLYVWSDSSNSWENIGVYQKIEKPNIASISSVDKKVYNSGQINYTTRYIQRSVGTTSAALKIDEYKNYIYKPSLLWEAQGNENRQTINELAGQNGGFVLGAIPLNSDLSNQPPYVLNNVMYNNIIDIGENVYWMTNYQGYFYANGEIIQYDAIEYSVSGLSSPVWVTSNQQYQDYFSRLRFNGKMYPTGRIRIYTNPELEEVDGEIRMKDANPVAINGRGQFGTPISNHSAGLDNDTFWRNNDNVRGCIQEASAYLFNTSQYINYPASLFNLDAGKEKTIGTTYINANALSQESNRYGIIKNFLTDKYFTENELAYKKTTSPGSVQSSALIIDGPEIPLVLDSNSFVTYICKDFVDDSGASIPYKHYGTRMRIIGSIESGTNKSQTPAGSFPIYTGGIGVEASPPLTTTDNTQETVINGGSGGIAFNINKDTNTGYYFEIVSLTVDNLEEYNNNNNASFISANIISNPAPSCSGDTVTVWTENQIEFKVGQTVLISGLVDANNPTNVNTPLNGEYTITAISENKKQFQYKINTTLNTTSQTGGIATIDIGTATNIANIVFYKVLADSNGNAIPVRLWSGLSKINVDSGEFYGQGRLLGEDNTTVYDLAAEYVNIGSSRRFYLYINNKQIATVDDLSPLEERNSLALFVRGTSKCMFDNVYALTKNYSQNTLFPVQEGVAQIFGDNEIDATESFRKYAISGIIQKTYLSGISSLEDPAYQMYFEEFGTILREMAYFNILYDRAYPSLYAKLMKTTNRLKGYTTSGFYAWSYGAEFLIFNATDFAITLDDTSGNYLRIIGAAFTQNTTYTITVDDLYKKTSNFLDSPLSISSTLSNPFTAEKEFNSIKNSREKYGINEISIESPYIQSTDAAQNIFSWTIEKISKPKKMIGINAFASENLQLGDIVKVNYVSHEGIDIVTDSNKRFVIYQIEYSRGSEGPNTVMFLAEV